MILSKNVKVLKNVLVHGLLPCGETVLNHVEVEPIPVRYYLKNLNKSYLDLGCQFSQKQAKLELVKIQNPKFSYLKYTFNALTCFESNFSFSIS